ncbi:ATP-dependent helicase HrpB [Rhodobacteraceae bacterium 2376]|uniref:ATP-dependent helicase HrpB n=1 Tax=Rhabdonatronobacter sediminivivens TaxID=2743469 RepID=A0A7Z0HZ02_9RHOB|nr:ATP-dependent helicase HrpB [Rhabdonatronobacter sediminivivens]NYS24617.1 ATP-dependent helicase HrpB [Rhabdonatronobacter sediminivivens]
MRPLSPLPVDAILPALRAALLHHGRAVLQAPPGAGKTTRVPLALLPDIHGRIILLEPRRLAARAAAEHMAALLGEPPGERVGYRIRGEAAVSARTRIEVVTEGILTRMLQSDPDLPGVGAIIFDEFHERSLQADLGLALAWEARAILRPDLQLLVMSATLEAAPVAALMEDAPVLTAEGRAYPVETRWLDRPQPPGQRLDAAASALITDALVSTSGGLLAFLPGEGEIRRVATRLQGALPADTHLHMLFGAMPLRDQRAAIAPAAQGRKLVLATAIAETSLTIEDIRVVVDCGRARRARFDPGSGMSRLVTEPVSRAEADQRRGRAGRVAPGVCFRMWARAQEGALPAFPPAEIEAADLAGLALDLAAWGGGDALRFLTPPPAAALAEARALLQMLGALDHAGRITPHGQAMARLPLHPRLAHMLLQGGAPAADLAALLAGRDPLRGSAPVDLDLRLSALRDPRGFADRHPWTADRGAIETARTEAQRLRRVIRGAARPAEPLPPGALAALAYPDRIGLRRKGEAPRYLLSGGRGAALPPDDPLANARLIVATDLDGAGREARIRQAATLTESTLRDLYAERIHWADHCAWSRRHRRVEARQQERLGALVLQDRIWHDAPPEAIAAAAAEGVRDLGLPLSDPARRLMARVALLHGQGCDLPDMSEPALLERVDDWLAPWLGTCRDADSLRALDLLPALQAMLDHDQRQLLDRLAPAQFTTPLGHRLPIDYSEATPAIEVRVQELFGVTTHPCVGPDRQPLKITLLSPARRPVQVTMDLPGFWASSYAEVRKDMRARYPRHPWPEDPTQADPTLRAKPRGR